MRRIVIIILLLFAIAASEIHKKWAVVIFGNGVASEIPSKWIKTTDGKSECYWPKNRNSNISNLIEAAEDTNDKDFKLCPLKTIETYCGMYGLFTVWNLINEILEIGLRKRNITNENVGIWGGLFTKKNRTEAM